MVTGRNSYKSCGAKAVIDSFFSTNEYIHFSDFEVNPKISDGIKGLQIAQEGNIDLILAVGGGSVIDMAKMIKAFLVAPNDTEALVRGEKQVPNTNIPLIAVPTTAGSGSEATHFAVVYIGKEKFSLASPYLLPEEAILNGKLLKSASAYQKAINGLDALAQAIEGAWAVASTKENRAWSFKAIRLLSRHLPDMVKGGSTEDLQNIMLASNLAGKSINITKTTAPHAFSYAFTSYHNIAHGHAVWLTLPEIFAIHMTAKDKKITDPRGADFFTNLMKEIAHEMGIKSASKSAFTLRSFMKEIGVEPDMGKLGIKTQEQRRFIADKINLQRFSNNPVAIRNEEIKLIFNL